MLPYSELTNPPGFFHFRWELAASCSGARDVAVAFKVPGALTDGALSELFETVCRGPLLPDAVILLQIDGDASPLKLELVKPSVSDALLRFQDRLPLLLAEFCLKDLSISVIGIRPSEEAKSEDIVNYVHSNAKEMFKAGLASIFNKEIVTLAPVGYSFLKPSGKTAPYFIRADAGLASSGAIAFTALALWKKLVSDRAELPFTIEQIMLDTMAISPVAFSLRELFVLAGLKRQPIVESFHSYGGIEHVPQPIRGQLLCLISASSSMEMHREWVRTKGVATTDAVTLVTFEDCEDASAALCLLPCQLRPLVARTSAAHHIRISGENFVAGSEAPKQILLRKPIHSWPDGVKLLRQSAIDEQTPLFDVFRPSKHSSVTRRALFVEAELLAQSSTFNQFLEKKLPQHIRAITRQIIHQDDAGSKELAERTAVYCNEILGIGEISLLSFTDVARDPTTVESDVGIIVIGVIAGGGSALLGVSRNLRGVHRGPRLFLIGIQVAEASSQLRTLDNNLRASAHGASIEIVRYGELAIGSSLMASFEDEVVLYSSSDVAAIPEALRERQTLLSSAQSRRLDRAFLPWDADCARSLILRKDFVFWDPGYAEGPHQSAVLATIAVLLQRARESSTISESNRLHAPRPTHVTLDPENFARFDDGIIQAAILRAALPSELDYRSDHAASAHLRSYLIRCTSYIGTSRAEGVLEFLLALTTGKLQLTEDDKKLVIDAFKSYAQNNVTAIAEVIEWFVRKLRGDMDTASSLPI